VQDNKPNPIRKGRHMYTAAYMPPTKWADPVFWMAKDASDEYQMNIRWISRDSDVEHLGDRKMMKNCKIIDCSLFFMPAEGTSYEALPHSIYLDVSRRLGKEE